MGEAEVRAKLRDFIQRAIRNLRELKADELIEEGAINPFLIKALGFNDFESLARFYVYQRVGRSVMTGFGTTIEHIIRALARGHRTGWWDVVTNIGGTPWYMSIKSGPRDMDKDQVIYFSNRAKELMENNPGAVPIIAMGYGKEPWPIIPGTLQNEGLDPSKHMLLGRRLYDKITGEVGYHRRLLEITHEVAVQELEGREVINLIEDKVKEVISYFKKRYKTIDELLLDTF